jgi:hypothetical protein
LTDRDDLLIRTLLWADPVTQNVKYGDPTRSDVPTYGMIAVREFLRENHLKLIVRAHQCVNGVQLTTGFPVITVFSASNYRTKPPNDSGVVEIDVTGSILFNVSEIATKKNIFKSGRKVSAIGNVFAGGSTEFEVVKQIFGTEFGRGTFGFKKNRAEQKTSKSTAIFFVRVGVGFKLNVNGVLERKRKKRKIVESGRTCDVK